MDMIAERMIAARERGWQERDEEGRQGDRTLGSRISAERRSTTRRTISSSALHGDGAIQIENQARIRHSSTVPGLGTSLGRGGATNFQQDFQNANCVLDSGLGADGGPSRRLALGDEGA